MSIFAKTNNITSLNQNAMKKLLHTNLWSAAVSCLGRSVQLLTVLLALSVTANAQDSKQQTFNLHKLMQKRAIPKNFPKPDFPIATAEDMRRAHDASGAPLNFPDRVWFPGEWEEVKAVVVAIPYTYFVPDKKEDTRYSALPIVQGYAIYYYAESKDDPVKEVGRGSYESYFDLNSESGQVALRLIDGIQRAGAEAWVRIEQPGDEQVVRYYMEAHEMRTDKIRFFVSGGNSVWFRDCGPICFYYGDEDKVAMLDFLYDYERPLDDVLPSVLHRQIGIPNYINQVIWEGGNCLVDGAGGLMTSTAMYSHNKEVTVGPVIWDGKDPATIKYTTRETLNSDQCYDALKGMVGQAGTTIVERLKHDGGTGHVDLYADAIDENGFLFAKMPETYKDWEDYAIVKDNVAFMLKQKNCWQDQYVKWGDLPFPSYNDGSDWNSEEDYQNFTRTYANHLIVNNYILQPCFSPVDVDNMPTAAWDRANIEAMKKLYPGYTFYCLDMRIYDGSGGSIHCITKQIPADNPVRILHDAMYGKVNFGTLTEVPFSAFITNKSGIQKASLHYQVGEDGEWQKVDMTGNGNRWYCRVPVSKFPQGKKVFYYIEATSKNGKTITKPVTANHGGFYNFTPDETVEYKADDYDFSTEPVAKEKITFQLDTRWLTEDKSSQKPTGISEITTSKDFSAPSVWYTLGGLRLNEAPKAKGIYIYHGKKVVIK